MPNLNFIVIAESQFTKSNAHQITCRIVNVSVCKGLVISTLWLSWGRHQQEMMIQQPQARFYMYTLYTIVLFLTEEVHVGIYFS